MAHTRCRSTRKSEVQGYSRSLGSRTVAGAGRVLDDRSGAFDGDVRRLPASELASWRRFGA